MLEADGRGEDLHALTARQILGKQQVSKSDRQLAKAINFGLLFGLGAAGFRVSARSHYDLELTREQAAAYRRAFFDAYPALARWHRQAGRKGAKECRTLAGRRRLLDDKTPSTHRLNTPVQGTEADGLKQRWACSGSGATNARTPSRSLSSTTRSSSSAPRATQAPWPPGSSRRWWMAWLR